MEPQLEESTDRLANLLLVPGPDLRLFYRVFAQAFPQLAARYGLAGLFAAVALGKMKSKYHDDTVLRFNPQGLSLFCSVGRRFAGIVANFNARDGLFKLFTRNSAELNIFISNYNLAIRELNQYWGQESESET